MNQKNYRANVCAVIRRKSDNSVLFCHRKGCPSDKGWQFPQGGIDQGKDLIEEMKRELREEIGTDSITICQISPKTYSYDFPGGVLVKGNQIYHGQQQYWILAELDSEDNLFCFKGDNAQAEFDMYTWVTPHKAIEKIVEFKKAVYEQALHDLGLV